MTTGEWTYGGPNAALELLEARVALTAITQRSLAGSQRADGTCGHGSTTRPIVVWRELSDRRRTAFPRGRRSCHPRLIRSGWWMRSLVEGGCGTGFLGASSGCPSPNVGGLSRQRSGRHQWLRAAAKTAASPAPLMAPAVAVYPVGGPIGSEVKRSLAPSSASISLIEVGRYIR